MVHFCPKIKYKTLILDLNYTLYITPLRHERMCKWLNLNSTREVAVREGRVGVG